MAKTSTVHTQRDPERMLKIILGIIYISTADQTNPRAHMQKLLISYTRAGRRENPRRRSSLGTSPLRHI